KTEHNLHRILRAIDNNVLLTKLVPEDICRSDERMQPQEELLALFKEHPQLVANTVKVQESCHVAFDCTTPKNRKHYTGSNEGEKKLLRTLAEAGIKKRYGENHSQAIKRAEKALKVIDEL